MWHWFCSFAGICQLFLTVSGFLLSACLAMANPPVSQTSVLQASAPKTAANDPRNTNQWITIPAGDFLFGSTSRQVDEAYKISAAGYGHDRVRDYGWFDNEIPQHTVYLSAFRIMKTPVTQRQYAVFVHASGYPAPFVDAQTWVSYGLVHAYKRAQQYNWQGRGKNASPPPGKEGHPVVLIRVQDAEAYAAWLSKQIGRKLRLPNEAEWEKAMRGKDGRQYPWGNRYDSGRLNNADKGPFATMPVGSFPAGASPYGVLDAVGQVYEWTATHQDSGGQARRIVKGGSWDDHGGICRPAAHHSRPANLKHILIGFRLVESLNDASSVER